MQNLNLSEISSTLPGKMVNNIALFVLCFMQSTSFSVNTQILLPVTTTYCCYIWYLDNGLISAALTNPVFVPPPFRGGGGGGQRYISRTAAGNRA